MQIVINIDENLYTRLFDNGTELNTDDRYDLEQSVRHGRVLPKHSRLIDADELIKQAWDADDSKMGWIYVVEVGDIENAPTIIEADKEAEDVRKPD